MKDLITLLLIALVAGGEAILWVKNPMHVPAPFVTARAFGLQLFDEPGNSMQPAVMEGKRVLVSSWPYFLRAPQKGDIVAFVYPPDPTVADLKRIVAAGGSSVEIRNGVLYVDGKSNDEPTLSSGDAPPGYSRSMSRRHTPAGSYFVMGDNRYQSLDSRSYGFISRDAIIGKRWLF